MHDAIEAGSYQGHQRTVSRGDAAAGLERAAYRFSGELEIGGQEHFYLETKAALALVDENGQIFVQSSTQHPSETQDIVAHVLGLPAHEVTVQCLRMGGGFGGKEFQPHGLAAVAALGATLTGHPVSLRLNRTQDITMTGKRHPFFATWEAGFDAGQRLCALRATLTSTAAGAWTCPSRCWPGRCATSTTRTGSPTSRSPGGSPRPTGNRTPRSAASAGRRA